MEDKKGEKRYKTIASRNTKYMLKKLHLEDTSSSEIVVPNNIGKMLLE